MLTVCAFVCVLLRFVFVFDWRVFTLVFVLLYYLIFLYVLSRRYASFVFCPLLCVFIPGVCVLCFTPFRVCVFIIYIYTLIYVMLVVLLLCLCDLLFVYLCIAYVLLKDIYIYIFMCCSCY